MVPRRLNPKCASRANHVDQAAVVVRDKGNASNKRPERKAKGNASHCTAERKVAATANAKVATATNPAVMTVGRTNNVHSNRACVPNIIPMPSTPGASNPHVAKAASATTVVCKGNANNAHAKRDNATDNANRAKASKLAHRVSASRSAKANAPTHATTGVRATPVTLRKTSLASHVPSTVNVALMAINRTMLP